MSDSLTSIRFMYSGPDFSEPVLVRTDWATGVTRNRESAAQRAKLMAAPKLGIEYSVAALSPSEQAIVRGRAIQETAAALVCPIWTEYGTLVTNGGNSVTLAASITSLKFKVGSWIFAKQGANECFRKITAVAGAVVSLSASGADKDPPGFNFALFTAGARIYPCIVGIHGDNSYRLVSGRIDRTVYRVVVQEL